MSKLFACVCRQLVKFRRDGDRDTKVVDFGNQGILGDGILVFLAFLEKVNGNLYFGQAVSKNLILISF